MIYDKYKGKNTGPHCGKIPVGARFFAHVQTGPVAHPGCTMGTESFLEVKRPGRCADHPPPPSAEVENEWSYRRTSTPTLRPLWPVKS
jgi:hypothetical protein